MLEEKNDSFRTLHKQKLRSHKTIKRIIILSSLFLFFLFIKSSLLITDRRYNIVNIASLVWHWGVGMLRYAVTAGRNGNVFNPIPPVERERVITLLQTSFKTIVTTQWGFESSCCKSELSLFNMIKGNSRISVNSH